MDRSTSSIKIRAQSASHATRERHKYGAAVVSQTEQQAEEVARDFNTFLADPRHNGKPIYLKPSAKGPAEPAQGEQAQEEGLQVTAKKQDSFLSTAPLSQHESKLAWVTESLLGQSLRAHQRIARMATVLTRHGDEQVKKAADSVLNEVTTGRATYYGALASSGDLRQSMEALIIALDSAKSRANASSKGQNEPEAKPLTEPAAKPQNEAEPKPQAAAQSELPLAKRQDPSVPKGPRSYTKELKKKQQQQIASIAPPLQPVPLAATPNTVWKQGWDAHHPPSYCCPTRGTEPRFQKIPKEIAAMAVHSVLTGGRTAPAGTLFMTRYPDPGLDIDFFGVRPPGSKVAPEVAKAQRIEFAEFLVDLCKANLNDRNPKVSDAAAKGLKLAQFSLEKDQDLPNGPGMIKLFEVLAGQKVGTTTTPRPPERSDERAQERPVVTRPQRKPQPPLKANAPSGVGAKSPAPQTAERPVVAMAASNGRGPFYPNRKAAQALLDSLSGAPDTHVLKTTVPSGAGVYVDTLAPVAVPGGSRHGPADAATCQLLKALAEEHRYNRDSSVRKRAQQLYAIAEASENGNTGIPNHPSLRTILTALAQAHR